MKSVNLQDSIGQLQDAGDQLQRAWEETFDVWKDSAAVNIEQNHLYPLFQELSKAMNAIGRLAELAARAERECGPETEEPY